MSNKGHSHSHSKPHVVDHGAHRATATAAKGAHPDPEKSKEEGLGKVQPPPGHVEPPTPLTADAVDRVEFEQGVRLARAGVGLPPNATPSTKAGYDALIKEIGAEKKPKGKFYKTQNSNSFVEADGHRIAFEPYSLVGGSWLGIYTTDDAEEQKALGALSKEPKSPVQEIDWDEYQALTKKKMVTQDLPASSPSPRSTRKAGDQASLSGKGARVVENRADSSNKPKAGSVVIENPGDALKTSPVSHSTPPPKV